MSEEHAHAGAGPIAEEAVRLIGAVQDWARRSFPEPSAASSDARGSDCQWCPICQFIAVVRGERPELTERVVEAGTAVASAVRAFVEAAAGTGRTASEEQPRSPRVQRIDLRDVGDDADGEA